MGLCKDKTSPTPNPYICQNLLSYATIKSRYYKSAGCAGHENSLDLNKLKIKFYVHESN